MCEIECPKHDTGGGPCYCPTVAIPCESHHNACDCREHKVAVLIKAAIDAAKDLDDLRSVSALNPEEKSRLTCVVERVYSSCEALGVEIGAHEVTE